jgi:PASTA domain/RDD family
VRDRTSLGRIGYPRAFARWFVIALFWLVLLLPGLLDGLSPLWDAKRQAWHDKVVRQRRDPTLGMRVHLIPAAVVLGLVLVGTACSAAHPKRVPDVTDQRLDVAEDTLDALGVPYETAGGGVFGIVMRSHWVVCKQSPPAHRIASSVLLVVARSCSVPDVVGESLDDAEDQLEQSGIDVQEHSLDDEPILVESLWTVCGQSPAAGASVRPVDLYVSHDCWWAED